MKWLVAFPLVLVAICALLTIQPTAAFTSTSLVVQVYSDGSVLATQSLAVNTSAGSVGIPLLSPVLSDVVATDQNGSPLSWRITGNNITVYTLGASDITLSYETLDLTNKTGTVWTLGFVTEYNTTVVLPKSSSVTSISGTPYSLQVVAGSPVATVMPGSWKIDYGIPIGNPQTSATTVVGTSGGTGTSTSTGGTPGGGTGGGPGGGILGLTQAQFEELGVVIVLAAVVAAGFLLWRRRQGLGLQGEELRPDDVKVIAFIQESGGKVLEPEIRMKFGLPKTSGWRQIKRLERMGYVKVTKIGSQNQIELVKSGK